MEIFDTIIIGAGPAGLKTAEILGNAGKKVLLIEKNEKIGPKICAGGLTKKSKKYLNLPENIIEKSFSSIVFRSPHFKTKIQLKENYFFLINREELGQWQLKKLNNQNVTVRTKTRVTKITKDFIIINDTEKIGYHHLVGADGSVSIVRRYLKIPTKLYGVAIQYLIPQNNFNDFEIHYDSNIFNCWYAWIFPRDGYVSVGYAYSSKDLLPKKMTIIEVQKGFEFWAKKNKINLTGISYQSFPINYDFRGYKFGNTYLVGDAAGLASSFTGEGIYQALVSGEEVARIILDNKHKPILIKKILKELKMHYFLLKLVYFYGFFRNLIFDLIVLSAKIKFIGRILVRMLN